MSDNRRPSKLAVILHADIAGSTILVQQDEHLAHERIQDTFQRFSETIEKYHGRVREIRGDALLAEFERASDAVAAVLAFQADQAEYIAQLNDNIHPVVRVGIALGEVIIADNTVTGAGVVLAQRVEQLARPGGVCITAAIHEALPQRMPFDQENLGEQQVKGFDEQIRVYTVSLAPGATIPEPETSPQVEALGSPDKPSIAVLPFTNMSGDPEQEYFADGMVEDIITDLSRFKDLLVIARNSSFSYKGKPITIQRVASELGVRYVVEGSIRRAAKRLRITVQLIDASDESHLWGERYDREMEDIFTVQDEVVRIITSTLVGRVEHDHRGRAQLKAKVNLDAYDWFIQGRELFYKGTAEDNKTACNMFQKAVELDPEYAAAYALLSETFIRDWATFWNEPLQTSYEDAWTYAKRSLNLDDSDSRSRTAMGYAYYWQGNFEQALLHLEKALSLNPGDMRALNYIARVEASSGNPDGAIERLTEVGRNNPYGKFDWNFVPAYYLSQRYKEAIQVLESILNPAPLMLPWMAAIYVRMDDMENARRVASDFVGIAQVKLEAQAAVPCSWIEFVAQRCPFSNQQHIEGFANDLRKAGLSG